MLANSKCVGIIGARGRSFSGRGGDQLGGRHTRPKPSVAVAASTETAASTHEAILSSPVGREMMRSVAVAPQSSERSLDGQSSGASLLPTSSAAALVPTRREISLRRIRNRAVRRSDLAIPRFLPPAHFVSDATVRRLVRRCREDVADQKRWEDQAEQARIDAEVKRIESEEKAQLAAEMKAAWECEQQEIRDEVTRQAAVARQVSADEMHACLTAASHCQLRGFTPASGAQCLLPSRLQLSPVPCRKSPAEAVGTHFVVLLSTSAAAT